MRGRREGQRREARGRREGQRREARGRREGRKKVRGSTDMDMGHQCVEG